MAEGPIAKIVGLAKLIGLKTVIAVSPCHSERSEESAFLVYAHLSALRRKSILCHPERSASLQLTLKKLNGA